MCLYEECASAGVPAGVNVAPIVLILTNEEVTCSLEAAAERGATSAGYTVLRLPRAVRELSEDGLDRHAPHRKNRVLKRMVALRGAEMNDTEFGVRMTGTDLQADTPSTTCSHAPAGSTGSTARPTPSTPTPFADDPAVRSGCSRGAATNRNRHGT